MSVVAKQCPHIAITIVDVNAERIAAWNDQNLENLPVYEPQMLF